MSAARTSTKGQKRTSPFGLKLNRRCDRLLSDDLVVMRLARPTILFVIPFGLDAVRWQVVRAGD
jgi:hypothetical protein